MKLFLGKDNVDLLKVSQNDYGKDFDIFLYDTEGNKFNTSDKIITIEWRKPNGKCYIQNKNINSNGNKVTFLLDEQVTVFSGEGYFNIVIKDSAKRESTFTAKYIVVRGAMGGDSEIEEEITSTLRELENSIVTGEQTIENIKETATKYPPTSQLYADVQGMKDRGYDKECNLISDCNTVLSTGHYGTNNTTSNTPIAKTIGFLDVKAKGGNVIQIWHDYNNKYIYTRAYNLLDENGVTTSTRTWKPWEKLNKNSSDFDMFKRGTNNANNYYLLAKYSFVTGSLVTSDFSDTIAISRADGNWSGNLSSTIINVSLRDSDNSLEGCTITYLTEKMEYVDIVGVYKETTGTDGQDMGEGVLSLYVHSTKAFMNIGGRSLAFSKAGALNRKYYKTGSILSSLPSGTKITSKDCLVERVRKGTSTINNTAVTQDSTHRFVSDTQIDKWNKNTRVFEEGFNAVNTETLSCVSADDCNHVVADIFIENKTNVTDFQCFVNGNGMRIENGGGAIILHIDFVKTSTSSWTYKLTGTIEVTSTGEYHYNRVGVLSSTTKINSIGIKCINTSDTFSCGKIIVKKY